jgi:hypothetical protein
VLTPSIGTRLRLASFAPRLVQIRGCGAGKRRELF